MLKNKTIVITGAAGLLGRHMTEALFRAGANVVVTDLANADCARVKNTISKTSDRLFTHALDITDRNSIQTCVSAILKKFKRIDGLVNNAVFRPPNEDFLKRSLENFKKSTDVNVHGVFLVTREMVKVMKKQKSGAIVNIGSIYGMVGNDQAIYDKSIYPGATEVNYDYYCFQKGGLINFTRYLAALLGKHHIRVNTLSPGGIEWGQSKKFVRTYSKRTPLGRMMKPQEVCGSLVFLLSDDASYITGHNLVVDGGWTSW